MVQVKESKASLVTIPFNVVTMLESVKEETLEPKIEDGNANFGYIENSEDNSEMEIKYEPLICAQADPVPVKSTTDGSDTG